jgi:uncharacterized protein (TIGR03545 family)/uncharacterized protein (TIGR03546 family)
MLLLRLLQKMVRALHSDGTPGQVAAGIALGSAFGFIPLLSFANLVIFVVVMVLNVSFPGAMLGWIVFTPIGFILDPLFDSLGAALLIRFPLLESVWTALYNAPLFPLTDYNNTVVLGSIVGWGVLAVPIFFGARWGVSRYRESVAERIRRSKFMKAMMAPLLVVLVLFALLWILLVDSAVRRSVELVGTELVGAKVEVESADVRLREGFVTLRGLRVTNPNAPMTNLFEAAEIVADVRVLALAEKKIFIDTVAVRDLRFGTQRETSGALPEPTVTNTLIRSQIDAWADRVVIPEFSLAGLGQAVNTSAIHPDSLRTPAIASGVVGNADSIRARWEGQIGALDPRPTIDSARALVDRLEGMSASPLNVAAIVGAVDAARRTVADLNELETRVTSLDDSVRSSVDWVGGQADALLEAEAADLARARALLQIPSLNAPDLAPSLFGKFALERIQPVLYWLGVAERYMPPGLDPRRRPGPKRPRRAGETVDFPVRGGLPAFTVAFAEASLAVGGEGVGVGDYSGTLTSLTSAPTVLGRPLRLDARRLGAQVGPTDISFSAVLDHVNETTADTVALSLSGISLPKIQLPGLAAELDLGRGAAELSLARTGEGVEGRWLWRSSDVSWGRLPLETGADAADRVMGILWESISALEDVEIEVRISGNIDGPQLGIRSNIASAVAASLQQRLRNEIASAERQVREEVERLVSGPVSDARATVASLEADLLEPLVADRLEIESLKEEFEAQLRRLTRVVPPDPMP